MAQSMSSIYNLAILVVVAVILEGIRAKPPSRVLGGEDGQIGEFPYLASVRKNDVHKCGGTIIGKRHILTAAHCIHGVSTDPAKEMTVVTGTNAVVPGAGITHAIKSVTIAPNYSDKYEDAWVNDIAVIALTKDIVFDMFSKPANLPKVDTSESVRCVASGWGDMSYPKALIPANVRKLGMTTISNEKCLQGHNARLNLKESHLCAEEGYGHGLCFGDSGGPLVSVSDNTVVGVASFVTPCAVGNPDVFTRVHYYLDFINKAMTST